MLKIQLSRNLRRNLLRGHPWVYRESIQKPQKQVNKSEICQVLDHKNEHVGWALYDPYSPLALRLVSLDQKAPLPAFYEQKFQKALDLRKTFLKPNTNSYRLFNGEGDLLPGMICDIYNSIAILQFDGKGPREFWDRDFVTNWILNKTTCQTVIEKVRRPTEEKILQILGNKNPLFKENQTLIEIQEHGLKFKVDLDKGQKTGFFLDQRENRKYIQDISHEKSVLNLFSYTGGFSIYAGAAGAKKVGSCDVSEGAIQLAQENWALNLLPTEKHEGLCVDVFDYLKSGSELWDYIIVDPPSMSHSEDQKTRAQSKYIETFALAAKKVKPNGHLFLSSCSSHISFNDFFEIITESLSLARRRGQILRVSGQGSDHPFPHVSQEFRYLKFVHIAL